MKTLVQHLQEINDDMKDNGIKGDIRCKYLTKIGSILINAHECECEEILDACDYIDNYVLESDEVDDAYKAMITLSQLLRKM